MTNHEKRVRALEQRGGPATTGPIPVVELPRWPVADREAFERAEASGDRDAADALVEKHAGIRPGRGPGVTLVIADCRGPGCP